MLNYMDAKPEKYGAGRKLKRTAFTVNGEVVKYCYNLVVNGTVVLVL